MEVKPGYKQTEVGVIPEDWEITSIGDVCIYQNGTSLEQFFNRSDGFKVVSIGNYTSDGKYNENSTYISYTFRNEVRKYILNKNDLSMLLNDKTSQGTIIGRVLLFDVDDQFVFNQRTMRLSPRSGVESSFLYYSINGDYLHAAIVSLAKPGTQIYINTSDVTDLKLALPPPAEQRAIAEALSDVDALIDVLDRLIAKKRDLKQAAMQQLLTGKTKLPGFSGEWEVKCLGDVLKVRHGKSQYGIVTTDGKYPILATSGEIGRTNQYLYDKPSVLIGRKGTIDFPQYMDTPFWTIDTLFYTEISDSADPKFIFYKFNMINWRGYNEASGVPSLNASTIEKIEFSFPRLGEQTVIAAILSDMDTEITALEAKLAKARQLKQGMMQELLTGKTRLV